MPTFYLHYVLDLWFERKIKKQLRGRAQLVRYADDFVMLCSDPQDRENIQTLLKARLAQFGLAVAEDKTHQTEAINRTLIGHYNYYGMAVFSKKLCRAGSFQCSRFPRSKPAH